MSVTEEAARRTDPNDELYDKHIRTARKNGIHMLNAVYSYMTRRRRVPDQAAHERR